MSWLRRAAPLPPQVPYVLSLNPRVWRAFGSSGAALRPAAALRGLLGAPIGQRATLTREPINK